MAQEAPKTAQKGSKRTPKRISRCQKRRFPLGLNWFLTFSFCCHSGGHDGPSNLQDGPKTAQKAPKRAPRRPQRAPRWPKEAAKTVQKAPKTAQEDLKRAPRRP